MRTATRDELTNAYYRMLGRIDAANAENRRATRASYRAYRSGDHDRADRERECAERASNDGHRRILAAARILNARSRTVDTRCACGRGQVADGYTVCELCAWGSGRCPVTRRRVNPLAKCANGCEEDVVVVVCDHVAEGRDDQAEIEISGLGRDEIPRHDCGDPECGERALCGDCWGSL